MSREVELKSLILVLQLTSVDRIFRCSFQPVAKVRATVAKVRATPLNPRASLVLLLWKV